jgi:hypothetical protein
MLAPSKRVWSEKQYSRQNWTQWRTLLEDEGYEEVRGFLRGRASDGLVLTARGFGNCRDRVHTAASGDATFRFLSLPAMVDAATVNESIVHGVAVAFPDGHRYQEYRRICGI